MGVALLGLCSCGGGQLLGVARDELRTSYSGPADDVAMARLDDASVARLAVDQARRDQATQPPPPADVKADPVRYKEWLHEHSYNEAQVIKDAQRRRWVQARGCGKEEIRSCDYAGDMMQCILIWPLPPDAAPVVLPPTP